LVMIRFGAIIVFYQKNICIKFFEKYIKL